MLRAGNAAISGGNPLGAQGEPAYAFGHDFAHPLVIQ